MTTVDFEPFSVAVPLREDPPGVFRVGQSRVFLELVLLALHRGENAEGIGRSYPTLRLADVYASRSADIWRTRVPFDDYCSPLRTSRLRPFAARSRRYKVLALSKEELQAHTRQKG